MLIPQSFSNGPVQRSVCHDCYESNYSSTRSSERERCVVARRRCSTRRANRGPLSLFRTIEPLMAPRRSARKASEGKAAVDLTLSSSPSPSSDVEVQDALHRRSSPRKKTKTTTATTMEDADEAFARALQEEENAAAAAAVMDQGAPAAAGTSKANQSDAATMNSTLSGNAPPEASASTSEATQNDKDDPQAIVGAFRSLFVDGTGCQKCGAAGPSTENDNKTASKQSAVSGFVARLSSLWTIAALFDRVGVIRERRLGRWTDIEAAILLDLARQVWVLTRVRLALGNTGRQIPVCAPCDSHGRLDPARFSRPDLGALRDVRNRDLPRLRVRVRFERQWRGGEYQGRMLCRGEGHRAL
jgi:hypothetical protein